MHAQVAPFFHVPFLHPEAGPPQGLKGGLSVHNQPGISGTISENAKKNSLEKEGLFEPPNVGHVKRHT